VLHCVSATRGLAAGSGAWPAIIAREPTWPPRYWNQGPPSLALFLKGNFVDQRIDTAAAKVAQVEAKTVNLGLQGGGSHGAFTWGVLDRLLEDDRISFEGITASSAGRQDQRKFRPRTFARLSDGECHELLHLAVSL
jgi:hypothetical protein